MTQPPQWLAIARELFSISQSGLTYCKNEYDLDRYRRLQEMSAEIISGQTGLEQEDVLASLKMQPGYATPKVDVRAAVVRDGKILLVQEKADNHWSLPGGWADVGDLPSAMVEREVWEESGFRVRAQKLVAVYDANRVPLVPLEFYHAYKLIFLCELLDGEPTPSFETLGVDFFDPQKLPQLSLYRTNQAMIAEVFAHVIDPNRPAAFD
jgi:ADP-ribose pyrophosphatase YjhB (NUDIX family)